jgi:hypothetical protein
MPELIFTVTAGRTGTMYLSELMADHPRVCSAHEAPPAFNEVMRDVQSHPGEARRFWVERKLPAIERVCGAKPVYFEASHVFCEGFFEPLVELGYKPSLILLSRPWREIALSRWRRGDIPGRSPAGLEYLLHPGDPVLFPLADWGKYTNYQLCFWHVLEIYCRQVEYAKVVADYGGHVAAITLEQLCNPFWFAKMQSDIGLDPYTIEHFNQKLNAWDKNLDQIPEAIEDQEEAICRAFLEVCGV